MLGFSAACFQVISGDTLAGSLAQALVLAVAAAGAVALARPEVLRRSGARWGMPSLRVRGGLSRWVVVVLVVGALAGAVSWLLVQSAATGGEFDTGEVVLFSAERAPVFAMRFGAVALLCLFTGVFEEGVFRVLALDALAPAWGRGRHGLLAAAVASSVLFGLLHVSAADAALADSAIAWAQVILKPLQAGLFGFFMAALYVHTRSLWVAAGVHGMFNLLYLGPALMAGGMPSTYATGNPADLALLVATTFLFIFPVCVAARVLGK